MNVKIRSAGVLPFYINQRNEINFLLGCETFVPGWKESDKWGFFGGKIEETDASVEHGAARECYEETAGCLFSFAEIRNRLQAKDYPLAIDITYKKSRTVCYFVNIAFRDYPTMFRNCKHFVQYCGGKIDCIEKSQLKWFNYDQLRRELFQLKGSTSIVPVQTSSYQRRKPLFRKKFIEMMLFFYENDCAAHLQFHNPTVSKYIFYQVPSGGGPEGAEESSAGEKRNLHSHVLKK